MTHPKHAHADHDVLAVIRDRWSPRAFDPARDVSRADLSRLFEAARWAPSSMNEQPWRFVVADRARTHEAYDALLSALTDSNRAWAVAAPVLVMAAIQPTIERLGVDNRHAWYDAGQAVALLTMQATSMGLSIRQMEGFDRARAREACRIPAPFECAVIMAIGYAGDAELLAHERHRVAERAPRARKPIREFVFAGYWGHEY
jgi:nitroreductase